MKTTYLLLLTCLFQTAFGCSVVDRSFCEAAQNYQFVIKGRVIDTIQRGIRLEVLQVLKGFENRDTVVIWDGTDFDCNGLFPMNASMMGQPGDTILAVLPKIDSIENNWDVLGDYRRPNYFGWTTQLGIINDTLYGFVGGSVFVDSSQIRKMAFADFYSFWLSHEKGCLTLSDIDNPSASNILIYPNPFQDVLFVENTTSRSTLRLFSADSRLLLANTGISEPLQTQFLPAGIYYLLIKNGNNTVVKKIVKQ